MMKAVERRALENRSRNELEGPTLWLRKRVLQTVKEEGMGKDKANFTPACQGWRGTGAQNIWPAIESAAIATAPIPPLSGYLRQYP